MPKKKTVIVVGAGASEEVDFPTSAKLKQEIAKRLHFSMGMDPIGDGPIRALLLDKQDPRYFQACETIRAALPQATSIDSFIDARQGESEIELCGKLAIVRSILEAESNSRLYFREGTRLDFEKIQRTWFNAFWQKLSENCQSDGLEDRFSSIVLIIFNYDRCVEHFLYYAIQNYYGLSSDRAASLVNSMEIFHPYGTVGSLPWADGNTPTPFGAITHAQDLEILAGEIKTFSERIKAGYVDAIKDHVAAVDTLLFLGFAYHSQNIELLTPPADHPYVKRMQVMRNQHMRESIRCYGTAYGISSADHRVIKLNLMELCNLSPYTSPPPMDIEIGNLKCEQFFRDYWLTLSFA